MGELHLEIIIDRLLREFKVNANVGKPQVAYKESVKRKLLLKIPLKNKQVVGQYAQVIIEVKPLEEGEGKRFTTRLNQKAYSRICSSG